MRRVLAAPYTNARVVEAVEYTELELRRFLGELRANEALGNLNFLEVAVEEADNQWGVCGRVIEHA